HCASIFKQFGSDDLGSARSPEDPGKSWVLATWIPGQKAFRLEGGVAELLEVGSRIGVRVHYRGSGEATTDRSAVGLYFAKAPPTRQTTGLTFTGADSVIPVGSVPQQRKGSFTLSSDSEAIAIRPLVHPMLVSFQATAYRPDGSEEILVWTRGYKFDWQPTYYFKQRVALPKGTRVELIVYFDNSDDNQYNPNNPAKPVRWSELTTDPWCVFLLVSVGAP